MIFSVHLHKTEKNRGKAYFDTFETYILNVHWNCVHFVTFYSSRISILCCFHSKAWNLSITITNVLTLYTTHFKLT